MKQGKWTPWLYLLPALLIMALFIVYPTLNTLVLSFMDRTGTQSAATDCTAGQSCWGVLENYRYALTNPEMTQALANNALWLVLMVPGTVATGLLFAVLAERVRYEKLAKSIDHHFPLGSSDRERMATGARALTRGLKHTAHQRRRRLQPMAGHATHTLECRPHPGR